MDPTVTNKITDLTSYVTPIVAYLNNTVPRYEESVRIVAVTKPQVIALLTELKELHGILEQTMLAMPVPAPVTALSLHTQEISRSQQIIMGFTALCELLVQLSHDYREARQITDLGELTIISPLARSPALLLFPSHTIGLTVADAETIANHVNSQIRLTRPNALQIDAARILMLKKGMLLSREELPYTLLSRFLLIVCWVVGDDMSDADLVRVVGTELVNRKQQLEMARQGDEEMFDIVFAPADPLEECCNGFRTMTVDDVTKCCQDKFQKVKRELCDICDCDECKQGQ
jgi:hypothetical protein